MICPTCKRDVPTRKNRFGDEIYSNHKMATAWSKTGNVSEETQKDLQPGHNPAAPYTFEQNCPMSGQPIDEKDGIL